jgi:hypothetical protein
MKNKIIQSSIVREFLKNKVSQTAIGRKYGLTRQDIGYILKKNNVNLNRDWNGIILDEKEIIRLYCEEKLGKVAISKVMGVSTTPIGRILRKNKLMRKGGFLKGNRPWNTGKELDKWITEKIGNTRIERGVAKGKNNPMWRGGITFEEYGFEWTYVLKESIRIRDKYTCQICGVKAKVVHHIDYNKKNCNPNNLITLCKKCHGKTNSKREYWKQYFLSRTTV